MSRWSNYLVRAAHRLDSGLDRVRYRLSERFARDALIAFPYLGYGTRDRLFVTGRVLEARDLEPARADASLWENLKNAYRRFESDEAPFAEVELGFGDLRRRVTADDEGYFFHWLELPEPLPAGHETLQQVDIDLIAPIRSRQEETRTTASVIVPDERAEFGIISDIDDTVLQTGATSVLSMARKVLFGNARTRMPFAGVDAFYRALHRDVNPIFYVSSSPWNLYDVLVEFLDLNDIPMGPLLLRDWGISSTELLPTSHGDHKLDAIEAILDTYPDLHFLLIGDSGQEDPEIYAEVVRRYPRQITGIYIRDVVGDAARNEQIRSLAAEMAAIGQELLLVPDTVTAARHAAGFGGIPADAIDEIARAMHDNEQRPKV